MAMIGGGVGPTDNSFCHSHIYTDAHTISTSQEKITTALSAYLALKVLGELKYNFGSWKCNDVSTIHLRPHVIW